MHKPQKFDENLLLSSNFKAIFLGHRTVIKKRLQNLHRIYMQCSSSEKKLIEKAYQQNQQIKEIYNKRIDPVKYDALPSSIQKPLEEYLTNLWTLLIEKDENKNKNIKDQCGNIYEHYCNLFKNKRQIFTVCPICGIEELLGEYDACSNQTDAIKKRAREAYDHYIPKALYPFISINFANLIPICHHCNSDYKGTYDTPYNDKDRQKCFDPYSGQNNNIEINIQCDNIIDDLKDSDYWSIELSSSDEIREEVDSWNRIFNIQERYVSRIKNKHDSWKQRIFNEYINEYKLSTFSLENFKSRMYGDINVTDQSSGIVQKAYYNYFFNKLLPSYIEMEEEINS